MPQAYSETMKSVHLRHHKKYGVKDQSGTLIQNIRIGSNGKRSQNLRAAYIRKRKVIGVQTGNTSSVTNYWNFTKGAESRTIRRKPV